ncbi:MAG TPA: hypothetical protein VGV89_05070 [Thermoplasmata archaeon]|nr:hypothetical protein [Thermoplasmata archaeon]
MAHRIHHIGTISSRHFAVPTLLHFDPEGTTATDLDREHKGIVFEISAISDTIIITATSDLAPAELIKHLGHDLHRLYNSYVDHRLAFRGALSFGDFYREGNTIVGPAIDEAAEWHTLPDAACVIATPSAAALLDRLSRRRGGPAYVAFVQAPIPLKGGGTLSCWTLDWYRCWSGLSKLEGSFVRPPVPPEVARKLENTVALCRFLWDQFEKRHIRGIFPWRDASHRSVNKILRDIGKRGDRAEAAHSALIRAIKKDRDRELRAARAEPALLRLLNAFFEPLAHERPPRSTKPSARAYDNLVKRGFRYRLGSTATRRLRKFVEATKRVTPEMEEKAKELERVLAQN